VPATVVIHADEAKDLTRQVTARIRPPGVVLLVDARQVELHELGRSLDVELAFDVRERPAAMEPREVLLRVAAGDLRYRRRRGGRVEDLARIREDRLCVAGDRQRLAVPVQDRTAARRQHYVTGTLALGDLGELGGLHDLDPEEPSSDDREKHAHQRYEEPRPDCRRVAARASTRSSTLSGARRHRLA
jgi:hypothetical protein